jgi:hypothetical protein
MKRKPLLLALAMCFSFAVFGQKTDVEKIKTTFLQLPKAPLPKNVKSYDLRIVNNSGITLPADYAVGSMLKLEGFERKAQNPDVTLVISVEKVTPESKVLSKMVSPGTTSYFYVVSSRVDVTTRFLTGDTQYEFYRTSNFDQDMSSSFESTFFPNEQAAKQALANDKDAPDKVFKQSIDKTFMMLRDILNTNHGFAQITEYFPVWTIKSKDFDYADIDKAKELYLKSMADVSKSTLSEDNRKSLQEAVDIWTKNVNEYKPGEKNARISDKNIQELYMNLAMGNIWLQNFADAKKYFELGAKEKGLNQWKAVINTLLTNAEQGFNQNLLREKDQLNIAMQMSEFYSAPDFKIDQNAFRIKYIEYYDQVNPQRLSFRKVFEYDNNGLVRKIYSQKYDKIAGYSGESDVYEFRYNHTDKIMSVYHDKSIRPSVTIKVNDKKVVERNQFEPSEHNYKVDYNSGGDISRFVKTYADRTKEVVTFNYKQKKLSEIIRKIPAAQDTLLKSKIAFTWQGDAKSNVDFFYNINPGKAFGTPSYSEKFVYDEAGRVAKLNGGFQNRVYRYDATGNLLELILYSDTTPQHWTYQWEPGSGNSALFLNDIDAANNHPLVYPGVR